MEGEGELSWPKISLFLSNLTLLSSPPLSPQSKQALKVYMIGVKAYVVIFDDLLQHY